MSKNNQEKPPTGKGILILAAAPVICCGAFLLPVLIGTAGFATLAAVFKDPLFQAAAAIGIMVLVAVLWRRSLVRNRRHSET